MAFTRTYDGPEPVRINKWLGQTGVCSRREAEALIAAGMVTIDGESVTDAGRKIEPGQTLTLNDRGQAALASGVTILMHKPLGYVSGQPEPDKIPAVRLLTAENLVGEGTPPAEDASLPPIGRLDEDSRGLLMLSSDGVVAKAVIGPQSRLDKEYLVRIEGDVTEKKLALLRRGLMLDGRILKYAKVSRMEQNRLRFILTEGRNRQIRRMCEMVDLEVIDLLRIRVGPIHLNNLPEGKWRMITAEEREALISGQMG
ncbi:MULTISPECIES: pseudouridine synthase [unclassified Brevundimonas]|uniref:pseudouridine synthase n=1 Tax=unclassified Brevundimonas TaxID=2622653 RepID=UPI000CFBC69E|nr:MULTISPECIES: pseudouridine synthase [unclassified Brevundimonas]PRA26168.1 pseudouridylate synthase [Brevundimonas sp. MYb27]PQZ81726.1 pseudouridylate synthase [Brevundimonas sp. MYb31]PRB17521.1 pseudouridylate synthase [Brevundimonas sp. MYb52]PRB37894.1 pseudouridylate synthase [Brevundimonas sp. MYb46]PRB45780.1 pseudouridylate synthase [Brevundimonas sp. MYb33]